MMACPNVCYTARPPSADGGGRDEPALAMLEESMREQRRMAERMSRQARILERLLEARERRE